MHGLVGSGSFVRPAVPQQATLTYALQLELMALAKGLLEPSTETYEVSLGHVVGKLEDKPITVGGNVSGHYAVVVLGGVKRLKTSLMRETRKSH